MAIQDRLVILVACGEPGVIDALRDHVRENMHIGDTPFLITSQGGVTDIFRSIHGGPVMGTIKEAILTIRAQQTLVIVAADTDCFGSPSVISELPEDAKRLLLSRDLLRTQEIIVTELGIDDIPVIPLLCIKHKDGYDIHPAT